MRKGEITRQNILNRAIGLASRLGLEGLSIGALAQELRLSKSGLFAHFQSKEALQMKVLDAAAAVFSEHVLRPSVKAPRGLPRLQALFEAWLSWAKSKTHSGGCIFVAACVELDDRPGPVRDHLVSLQHYWLETRKRIIQTCVETGEFKANTDIEQFAYELYAMMLAYHYAARLLNDPEAEKRARTAFDRLLLSAQT